MTKRPWIRAEHFWWLGVMGWIALALLWRPDPPVSYLEAPSASPAPRGFAIFHDLLARETQGVRRILGRASAMPEDVDVFVILSPSGEVPANHMKEMAEWASGTGGTLVVGHPIYGEDGLILSSVQEDGFWETSTYEDASEVMESHLSYIPWGVETPREVPPFSQLLGGEMILSEFGAQALLSGESGEVAVSVESMGAGTLVQISDADILDNRALGWKQSHLFVAALLDEVGREKVWAIDEAHEGIEPEPSLVAYLGSGRWRPVLLQILLLLVMGYWWWAARMGRPRPAPVVRDAREVTTLAKDVGDFYLRAQKGGWALGRALELFKAGLKTRGVDSAVRSEAEEIVRRCEAELQAGTENTERNAFLIRKMASCRRRMAESSKGRRR